MRASLFLLVIAFSSGAQAWFGSDTPQYKQWSTGELQNWLRDRNINVPSSYSKAQLQELVQANWNSASGWTQDQYTRASKAFQDLRDSSFDAWDESRLRSFLVEQGVVAPSGPREQLVLQAKQQYRAFQDASSSFIASASSLSSKAAGSANTALYGDSKSQASKSLVSLAAQATKEAAKQLDDTKDYVYSTWDDSRLESYLREKGLLKEKKSRSDLLVMMRDAYAKSGDPIWEAWSDSCMRQWLIDHNILKSDQQKKRDELTALMRRYYYGINDTVWQTWADSDLKAWLVGHGIIKSEAEIKREKLTKLMEDNYSAASDTIWGSWSDSDIRGWLTTHGYLKSDSKSTRDELVKLINDKYTDASTRSAQYLTWPDARLRAYLREQGINDRDLPMTRPGLLQEVRIRWVQTSNGAEAIFAKIRDIVNNGVEAAEDSVGRILEILGVKTDAAREEANETLTAASEKVGDKLKKDKSAEEL